MNKTVSSILIFVAGVTAGSVTSCLLIKERYKRYYENIANEEIESYKAVRAKADAIRLKAQDLMDEKIERIEAPCKVTKKDFSEYVDKASIYNNNAEEGVAATIEDDKPYVISPDEFGELTYETVTFTYYADKVLADEVDDIVDDVAGTIGLDSLLHFGEYEDDCVHVRNDQLETDYEVLFDTRSYWGDIKRDGRPGR